MFTTARTAPRDESVCGAVRAVVNIARSRTRVDRGARERDRGRGAEGALARAGECGGGGRR
jgi:hypothetical protein